MKTKLQLAVDVLTPEELLELFPKLHEYVDIIELGTPFLLKYGAGIIPELKKIDSSVEVLADAKIMDAGYYEADELFKAGADYITVLGVTDKATLAECVRAGKENHKKTVVDMICVEDTRAMVEYLEELETEVIAVHTGVDQQAKGRTPLQDLKELKKYCKKAQIAVAGGINRKTLTEYLEYAPDIIIVGGGVFGVDDPVEAAKNLYEQIR